MTNGIIQRRSRSTRGGFLLALPKGGFSPDPGRWGNAANSTVWFFASEPEKVVYKLYLDGKDDSLFSPNTEILLTAIVRCLRSLFFGGCNRRSFYSLECPCPPARSSRRAYRPLLSGELHRLRPADEATPQRNWSSHTLTAVANRVISYQIRVPAEARGHTQASVTTSNPSFKDCLRWVKAATAFMTEAFRVKHKTSVVEDA